MVASKCPKCDSLVFEIAPAEISGARFKFWFIQCAKCGAVVGTHEHAHIGHLIHTLARKLGIDLDSEG